MKKSISKTFLDVNQRLLKKKPHHLGVDLCDMQ